MKNEKIKNDCENIEQNEITEDIIEDASENTEQRAVNAEHIEQTTSIALVSDKGEN